MKPPHGREQSSSRRQREANASCSPRARAPRILVQSERDRFLNGLCRVLLLFAFACIALNPQQIKAQPYDHRFLVDISNRVFQPWEYIANTNFSSQTRQGLGAPPDRSTSGQFGHDETYFAKSRNEDGIQTISLAPGTSITFPVPSYCLVKIADPTGPLSGDDIQVWTSNGSGLYIQRIPVEFGKAVIVPMDYSHPSLVKVCRPKHFSSDINLALFTSQLRNSDQPAHVTATEDWWETVKLTTTRNGSVEQCHRLSAGESRRFGLRGPARIAVETRLIYPPLESRRFQTYEIFVTSENGNKGVLQYETTSETRTLVIDQIGPMVVGQRERAYLRVPDGVRTLTLESTADVYIRFLHCGDPNYRLPSLNSPSSFRAASRPHGDDALDGRFRYHTYRGQYMSLLSLSPMELSSVGLVQRVARDNTYRLGGLSSVALARQLSLRSPLHDELRSLAHTTHRHHTRFHHLFPNRKGMDGEQRFAYFHVRRLRDPGVTPSQNMMAEQFITDATTRYLASGYFVPVGNQTGDAAVFHLPAQSYPSMLRVVVKHNTRSAGRRLSVQIDEGEPHIVEVHAEPQVTPEQFEPTTAELGLAAMHRLHGQFGAGTLGGPFGHPRGPAMTVPVHTAEIPLRGGARVVRIWSNDLAGDPPSIALQCRATKRFELSESAYLEMRRRYGAQGMEFWLSMIEPSSQPHDVTMGRSGTDTTAFSYAALRNHMVPLVRRLRSLEQSFVFGVNRPRFLNAKGGVDQSNSTGQFATVAQGLERRRQWLPALELWSSTLRQPRGRPSLVAWEGCIRCLKNLGEFALVERELRSALIHFDEEEIRIRAETLLRAHYIQMGNQASRTRLAAFLAIRKPTVTSLAELAAAFLEDEQYEDALLVALAMPAEHRDQCLVVRCALQLNWWHVFEAACHQLPVSDDRRFWTAHRSLQRGEYQAALKQFEKGGPRGQRFAEHLRQGIGIHRRLTNDSPSSKAQAIRQWEAWQQTHPGHLQWKDAAAAVIDYARAASIYSIERDLHQQSFQASPHRPVRLEVHGPRKLRLVTRPLHATGTQGPVDDWIHVRMGDRHYLVAINSNRPSSTLSLVGDVAHVPGNEVTCHLTVPAGRHEIEVSADRVELLVVPYLMRPETPLLVLPEVNRDTVLAMRRGDLVGVPEIRPAAGSRSSRELAATVLSEHGASPVTLAMKLQHGIQTPRQLDLLPRLLSNNTLLPHDLQARALSRNDFERAISIAYDEHDTDAILHRMAAITRWAEVDPSRTDQCVVMGRQMYQQHRHVAGIRELYLRLVRGMRWIIVPDVVSSAGLFSVDCQGWNPESPSLRTRKTTMVGFEPNEHVVFGHNQLVVAGEGDEPSTLRLEIGGVDINQGPVTPIKLSVEANPGGVNSIVVMPGEPSKRIDIPLRSGSHLVRCWLTSPLAGQYVRARVWHGNPRSLATAIMSSSQRHYYVATKDEPLVVGIAGPAVIRIDQLRDAVTSSEYVCVEDGLKQLELRPANADESAYFRVFRLQKDAHHQPIFPKFVSRPARPVSAPLLDSHDDDVPFHFDREYDTIVSESPPALMIPSVRGQTTPVFDLESGTGRDFVQPSAELLTNLGNGTWSSGIGWFQRRPVEEGPEAQDGADRFWQFQLARRRHDSRFRTYQRTELVARVRAKAGDTIGLRHGYWNQLPETDVNFQWSGSLFTQGGRSGIESDATRNPWSADFRVRLDRRIDISSVTYHRPMVTFFARHLNLDDVSTTFQALDQDVFTRFKSDHRHGVTLADTLMTQLWLDQKWWIRPTLMTNEDVNPFQPDHISLRGGFWQSLGLCEVGASYRIARYFSDDDRTSAGVQHLVYLDLTWDHWYTDRGHSELSIQVRHDVARDGTSANVVWTWHLGRVRDDRDFAPGERQFRRLHQQLRDGDLF